MAEDDLLNDVLADTSSPSAEPSRDNGGDNGGNGDDFESLLQAYERDRSNSGAHDADNSGNEGARELAAQPPAAAQRGPLSDDDLMLMAMRQEQHRVFLDEFLRKQHFEKLREQEKTDFSQVLGVANSRLHDMKHLPEDYAKRWLFSEYNIDSELQQAWDDRYESPEKTEHARKVVERALRRMEKEAKRVPTPEDLLATADRAAVAEAVRGASHRAPEPKAPSYGRMSDGEFAAARIRARGDQVQIGRCATSPPRVF